MTTKKLTSASMTILTKKLTKVQRAARIRVLEKVLQLIGGRDGAKRWCQAAMAKDSRGESVDADDRKAVMWCAGGALTKFGATGDSVWSEINTKLISKGKTTLAILNDTAGRGAVLRVLRSYKRKLERENGR